MTPRTVIRVGVAGLAATALLLSGCSGSSPTTSPGTGQSEAPASAAAPSSPAPSSAAPVSKPKAAEDPCQVISVEQMGKIVGAELDAAKPQIESDGALCTYTPVKGGRTAVVSIAGLSQGTLRSQVKSFEDEISGGKVSDVKVAGTDEALVLSGKQGAANTVGVLARKGQFIFASIVASPESQDKLQDAAEQVVRLLVDA